MDDSDLHRQRHTDMHTGTYANTETYTQRLTPHTDNTFYYVSSNLL